MQPGTPPYRFIIIIFLILPVVATVQGSGLSGDNGYTKIFLVKSLYLERGGVDGHVRELVNLIREKHSGHTVFVSSHSNIIHKILKETGAGTIAEIDETEYVNFFVMWLGSDGSSSYIRLQFDISE